MASLQDHINRFEDRCPYPDARIGVHNLVYWLERRAESVSGTLSDDYLLSLNAAFPNDIRMYFEISGNGRVYAAVTRGRRYALEIPVSLASDIDFGMLLESIEDVSNMGAR